MKKNFTSEDIAAMEQRYRANFINTITGFKALNLVGTRSENGQDNLAPFNSIFHVGAHPPLVGMISRPDSVDRHTLENIRKTGVYTLNHVHENMIDQAHQTAARYERDESEFDAVGLTAEIIEGFNAPFVKESRIKMGLEVKQITPIELNGTIMIIGEIKHIELEDELVADDGFIDLAKHGTTTVVGLDGYYRPQLLKRLAYAKPDEPLKEIK